MNKQYYVIFGNMWDGPFRFKEAERERRMWAQIYNNAMILKCVVDYNGKEVK